MSHALPPDFATSAAYPLFRLDPIGGSVEILQFDADDYRRAAFMDERVLARRRFDGWRLPLSVVLPELLAAPPRPPCRWIFHLGHCGSTLISRLLDGLPGVLGIREPLPLLELAGLQPERDAPLGRIDPQRFDTCLQLCIRALQRGFASTRAVVVKPTSWCSVLAPSLLSARAESRAVLVGLSLRRWLAAMLRDPGLRQTTRRQAPIRMAAWQQLSGDGGARIWQLNDAELLAMSWLVEQRRWQLLNAQERWELDYLDFDRFLQHPGEALYRVTQSLGLAASIEVVDAALADGPMQRYAKDERQTYSAGTRDHELSRASLEHADAIRNGMAWAEAACARLGWSELGAGLG